jgi:hypothetical protein
VQAVQDKEVGFLKAAKTFEMPRSTLLDYLKSVAGSSGRVVWGVGGDGLDGETVGSNSTWGIDVCPRLFVIVIHFAPYHRHDIV